MDIITALLTESSGTTSESSGTNQIMMYVLLGVLLVGVIVLFIFTSRKNKKKEQEQKDMLDAVAPGNKVTTIGGISGIVVEVNPEDDTFVLETGSEDSGKSYIKFLKQAIYQTDAKPVSAAKDEAKKDSKEETKEEVKEEPQEEAKEAPAEEVKEEPAKEEVKEEADKKTSDKK